jgi:long-subunit acyl-CoA synthetase (AMP-forming)
VPKLYEHVKWRLEAQGVTDPRSLPPHVRAGVRVRAGLDQCEWRIAYGSPMPVAVLEFFSALGLPILETYGLAEAAGVCAVGLGDRSGSGASGQALPGVGLRVDAAGGLSVRGPQVMRAYRGDPVLTAETLGPDGWLRTGDVADIDREGAVWILDRAEDLIIAATGARVSPTHVEAALRAAHPLIDHVAVIGDGRPYNVALVTLDAEVARALGERLLLLQDPTTDAVAAHPEVRRTVAAAVAEANAGLSAAERIERFGVLCDSWVPGGAHLTPAMKLRRRAIETTYAPQIEALYAVP